MSDYTCPVEGCDREGLESVDSVQMHIVATNDERHNEAAEKSAWTALDSDEQGESDSGGTRDSDPSDGDMPTDDEYDQQHDGDESTDNSDDPNDGGDRGGGAVPSLPVDPTTLLTVVAVGVVLYLTYKAVAGGGDPTPNGGGTTTSQGGSEDSDAPIDAEGEGERGLID